MLWRIPVLYAMAGALWIVGSDALVQQLFAPHVAARVQTFKGGFYVLGTAVLLYALLRPLVRNLAASQQLLQASENTYRIMFEGNPSPILVYDVESLQVLDANPAVTSLLEWSREELQGMAIDALSPAESSPVIRAAVQRLRLSPGGTYLTLERVLTRSGAVLDMETHTSPVNYKGHNARLAMLLDRTGALRAQRAHEQAMARLQEAQRIARMASWEVDPATGQGVFAPEVYDMTGAPADEPGRARHYHEVLVAADPASQLRLDQAVAELASGALRELDTLLPLASRNGQEQTVRLRAQVLRDERGRVRVRGTLQDVTEEEHTRRLLHEREHQFRELMRILPDGVMILGGERTFFSNPACALQFGYPGESLMGEPLERLVSAEDLPRVRHLLQQSAAGPVTLDLPAPVMQRRDGSPFRAGLTACAARYGGQDCTLLVVRDLTEPDRIREALAASNQELQAVARRLFSLQEEERRAISRDLHDDIGQAITAIKLSAHAALEDNDPAQRLVDLAEIIHIADTSLDKLRNLSTLLRPPQLDALGLEAALRGHAGLRLRSTAIALELDIQPLPQRPAPEIEQACFRIAQEALTNVLRHARARRVCLSLRDEDGDAITLCVSDDGAGFDPQQARGLGLVMMRERAQTAGGRLAIESAPAGGTHIRLRLPYVAAAAEAL